MPTKMDASIDHLPDELIITIFSFLDLDSFDKSSQVCKRWRNIAKRYLEFLAPEGLTTLFHKTNYKQASKYSKTQFFKSKKLILKDIVYSLAKTEIIEPTYKKISEHKSSEFVEKCRTLINAFIKRTDIENAKKYELITDFIQCIETGRVNALDYNDITEMNQLVENHLKYGAKQAMVPLLYASIAELNYEQKNLEEAIAIIEELPPVQFNVCSKVFSPNCKLYSSGYLLGTLTIPAAIFWIFYAISDPSSLNLGLAITSTLAFLIIAIALGYSYKKNPYQGNLSIPNPESAPNNEPSLLPQTANQSNTIEDQEHKTADDSSFEM